MLYDVYINGKLTWTGINWDTVRQHLGELFKEPPPEDELPLMVEFQAFKKPAPPRSAWD